MASYELRTLKDVMDAIDEEKQLDPGLISDDEKRRFIQDALDDIGDLGIFERAVSIPLVDHTGSVELRDHAPGLDRIVEVYWNGRALRPINPREIDHTRAGQSPQGYWQAGDYLMFYPALQDATGELMIEYVHRPLWPESEDDEIDLPREWRRLVVLYGVHRCHKKNGNKLSADDYVGEYEALKLRLYNKALQARNHRPVKIRGVDDGYGVDPWHTFR